MSELSTSKPYAGRYSCDPHLKNIIVDRITLWNRPLAYLLSAVTVFGIGFAAALGV